MMRKSSGSLLAYSVLSLISTAAQLEFSYHGCAGAMDSQDCLILILIVQSLGIAKQTHPHFRKLRGRGSTKNRRRFHFWGWFLILVVLALKIAYIERRLTGEHVHLRVLEKVRV